MSWIRRKIAIGLRNGLCAFECRYHPMSDRVQVMCIITRGRFPLLFLFPVMQTLDLIDTMIQMAHVKCSKMANKPFYSGPTLAICRGKQCLMHEANASYHSYQTASATPHSSKMRVFFGFRSFRVYPVAHADFISVGIPRTIPEVIFHHQRLNALTRNGNIT